MGITLQGSSRFMFSIHQHEIIGYFGVACLVVISNFFFCYTLYGTSFLEQVLKNDYLVRVNNFKRAVSDRIGGWLAA